MCTVCGAECVVDVNVSHVSHSLCQRSVVLGLALFKANILKQNDLARLNLSGQLLSVLAYNVLCQLDFLAKQLAQALSDGASEYFMFTSPFGRPRCEHRITAAL